MPLATGKHFNRLTIAADWLAVGVAASLPLSTSATGILLVIWLLVLVPTLDGKSLRRELKMPAGALPVVLVALGVLGMAWADVTWFERWKGLESFLKLLMIPLLLVQFRKSDRATCVFGAYLASCLVVLLLSFAYYFSNHIAYFFSGDSFKTVPVKNAATQSGEFVTCIFGLLYLAIDAFERKRWLWLTGLLTLAFGFLANILYVATGRTALVIILVLLGLLAIKRLSNRGIVAVCLGAILIGGIGWVSAPNLRERVTQIWTDYESYAANDQRNSSGERIEFYKKSLSFIVEAPVIGHGTGTITALFAKAVTGESGSAASATTNPHNQTFAVAIQLGLVGALVLWAMWMAHLLLFRGHGLAEWIGLVVVVQNIAGSVFNSHLFDFGQGWVYVVGVGVAGGVALKNRVLAATPARPS